MYRIQTRHPNNKALCRVPVMGWCSSNCSVAWWQERDQTPQLIVRDYFALCKDKMAWLKGIIIPNCTTFADRIAIIAISCELDIIRVYHEDMSY